MTALPPSSLALSTMRSIACLRLSSSSSVYWLTSPCRRAEKLAPKDLSKPMLRTTRPKATPSWASTARPGISKAVVTGNAEDEESVMTETLGRAAGLPSENDSRPPARCASVTWVSWDEAFAARYEDWSAQMTADVSFYVELAMAADGPVVELAVGTGRVAIPVAQATGRRVLGIDTSPAMLRQARDRAAQAGVELDLRECDMRDLALDEPAALIYCPYRALLHLPTWADRRRTFERVAASLAPGGRFAWNAFVFDHRIAAKLDGQPQEAPVPHTTRYGLGDNRIDLILNDGGKSSLWWATKNEWLGLLDVSGLELEVLHGGFAGEPLTDESREY